MQTRLSYALSWSTLVTLSRIYLDRLSIIERIHSFYYLDISFITIIASSMFRSCIISRASHCFWDYYSFLFICILLRRDHKTSNCLSIKIACTIIKLDIDLFIISLIKSLVVRICQLLQYFLTIWLLQLFVYSNILSIREARQSNWLRQSLFRLIVK